MFYLLVVYVYVVVELEIVFFFVDDFKIIFEVLVYLNEVGVFVKFYILLVFEIKRYLLYVFYYLFVGKCVFLCL